MRIEKKGRIKTKTRKHLPMKQSFFPSGFPIRSSNVDRNVQHKKYQIIKWWWWRSSYKRKRHRLLELLHHWFVWITKTGHFSCSKCCLCFWCFDGIPLYRKVYCFNAIKHILCFVVQILSEQNSIQTL